MSKWTYTVRLRASAGFLIFQKGRVRLRLYGQIILQRPKMPRLQKQLGAMGGAHVAAKAGTTTWWWTQTRCSGPQSQLAFAGWLKTSKKTTEPAWREDAHIHLPLSTRIF
jgi:hypothetical protein